MVFWMGILVSGLFACFAIKKGFYETWALGFNIIIAIYLAVLLGPLVSDVIPTGASAYSKILTVLSTAAACFLILHAISYTFITGQFSIPFPKIVDVVGAGLLGFLAAFLVWSFASLLIMTMPITKNTFVKEIGFNTELQQTNVSYVSWWCNMVNKIVSSEDSSETTQQAIGWLTAGSEPKAKACPTDKPFYARHSGLRDGGPLGRRATVAGTSEPNEPAEPNESEPNTTEKQ